MFFTIDVTVIYSKPNTGIETELLRVFNDMPVGKQELLLKIAKIL